MKNLTTRELDVYQLIKDGNSEKEIAKKLAIEIQTVKTHKKNVYKKLNIKRQIDLISQSKYGEFEKIGKPSIEGMWVSIYSFDSFIPGERSALREVIQINLEEVSRLTDSYFTWQGVNLAGITNSGVPCFYHKLIMKDLGMSVFGVWENKNTNHFGCFQLMVKNDFRYMHGKHLGNGSGGEVKVGVWNWVKLSSNFPLNHNEIKLNSFEFVAKLINDSLLTGEVIFLRDLIE